MNICNYELSLNLGKIPSAYIGISSYFFFPPPTHQIIRTAKWTGTGNIELQVVNPPPDYAVAFRDECECRPPGCNSDWKFNSNLCCDSQLAIGLESD